MIKFEITEILEFDEEKERARIKSAFNKTWQKRLNKLLDLFLNEEYQKADELYDALPYCDKEGCPGQEFVNPTVRDMIFAHLYAQLRGKTVKRI